MRLLTIDPGTRYTGYAFWDRLQTRPKKSGVLLSRGDDWRVRGEAQAEQVLPLAKLLPDVVIIEEPISMPSSSAGLAALYSGDILKLSHLAGMFHAIFLSVCEVRLIPPTEWKGQIPKKIVHRHIYQMFGIRGQSDETDAIGIGLWALGYLYNET